MKESHYELTYHNSFLWAKIIMALQFVCFFVVVFVFVFVVVVVVLQTTKHEILHP